MNSNQTEQELIFMIDSLEKYYDPTSPQYKFKYVFYNKVNHPFSRPMDFPEDLWNKSITSDSSMMPVILKGSEIEQRKKQQVEVASKINGSYDYLQDKVNMLRIRSEKIRSRINSCIALYRKIENNIYNKYREKKIETALMDEIYKLDTKIDGRSRLYVADKKDEILEYLLSLKNNLQDLLNKINDNLYEYEKRTFVYNNINKIY
ncbi:hypothetical protein NBO_508g0017 [Nosema bombycis CQ1]|uniref:Nucleoporin Nup54 alpha-helical domain-containing protein n=1 Tax=Nosema bombycis (strain CQ1 / CVCC 102059) TaxID=578461 RepID=R0KNC1_NOSB1|nr:hypothetical protein NBO_508g0017 [Nosema bombycis CQ1]|eukprot:EOB12166.1 hypothetical protein NBO_508g0017 [Nosema bombycis CQ1]